VFVKRDGAGGGGANRGGGGDDGGGGDGSQGNDRKQLKGGESESRTSSTRQPHASSPPLLRSGPTYTWDSWQAGDRRAPGSSTRTSLFSSANRGIECRRRRAIPNDYPSCRSLQSRDRRRSDIGSFRLLSYFELYFRSSWRTASSLSATPLSIAHNRIPTFILHYIILNN